MVLAFPGLKMSSGSETAISRGTGKSKVTDANCQQSELICSLDTVRYSFIMSLLLLNKQPVLLTGNFLIWKNICWAIVLWVLNWLKTHHLLSGDSGVGKTMIIQSVLKQLQKDGRDMSKLGTILGKVFLHNQAKSARYTVRGLSSYMRICKWYILILLCNMPWHVSWREISMSMFLSHSLLEDVTLLTAGYGGDVEKSVTGDSQSKIQKKMSICHPPNEEKRSVTLYFISYFLYLYFFRLLVGSFG